MLSAENFVKLYVESHNHLGFMTTHIQTNHQKGKQTNYIEHPSYNGFKNDVSWFNFFINRDFVTDSHVQKFLRSWEHNNLQILILIKPNDLLVNLFKTVNYYSWNDFWFCVTFSCPSVTSVRHAHLAYYFSLRISDIIN